MTTGRTRHEETGRRSGPEEPRPATSAKSQAEAKGSEEQDLSARVEELQGELQETAGRLLRLAADFENYKRRARQDQLDAIQYGSTELIMKLLPVLDDFRLILEHAPEDVDENWLKGVRLTEQKLEDVLASQGVSPIESVGTRFDPALHEAIGHEETSEYPEDTVVQELRRGYRLHDRVIRPALVKLARPARTSA